MFTAEQSRPENFPFKIGETIEINWHTRNGRMLETATVSQLLTGKHWGKDVIYCMMAKNVQGKEFAVCPSICKKANLQLKLF
jgi:hypothetical protein